MRTLRSSARRSSAEDQPQREHGQGDSEGDVDHEKHALQGHLGTGASGGDGSCSVAPSDGLVGGAGLGGRGEGGAAAIVIVGSSCEDEVLGSCARTSPRGVMTRVRLTLCFGGVGLEELRPLGRRAAASGWRTQQFGPVGRGCGLAQSLGPLLRRQPEVGAAREDGRTNVLRFVGRQVARLEAGGGDGRREARGR